MSEVINWPPTSSWTLVRVWQLKYSQHSLNGTTLWQFKNKFNCTNKINNKPNDYKKKKKNTLKIMIEQCNTTNEIKMKFKICSMKL